MSPGPNVQLALTFGGEHVGSVHRVEDIISVRLNSTRAALSVSELVGPNRPDLEAWFRPMIERRVEMDCWQPVTLESYFSERPAQPKHDPVNHPKHYTSHPSGVECIEVVRHMGFNLGNVVKYIWRDGLKGTEEVPLEDLRKAAWYLQDEIAKREI